MVVNDIDDFDDDEVAIIFENTERFKLSVFLNLVTSHLEMSCPE